MIINYYEPLTSFELAPEDAISHYQAKGLKKTYNWYQMINEQHDAAFTVAKMMDVDLLETVKGELDKAIANGGTLDDFKKNLIPTLQKRGWWGKKDQVNPITGLVEKVQLGSASRLENIFRTNLQSAYAAGHWKSIEENADDQPFLMYDAVDDHRTRKDHAENDSAVYPVDHKFWQTHYPPNGWGCRCGVIQMDADEVEDYGLTIGDKNFSPMTYPWANPSTGEVHKIPFGVDPGFAHNPGFSYVGQLKQLQSDKLTKMDTDSQQAAKKGIKATEDKAAQKKAAQKAIEAEKESIIALAKAQAKESAQAELNIIGQGKAAKYASIKKGIYDKYQKDGTAKAYADDPQGLLGKLVDAAEAKVKQKQIGDLVSSYKKKVIAGKLPTEKQQAAFDTLEDAKKAKILAQIDQAKAKQKQPQQSDSDAVPATAEENNNGLNPALRWESMKQIGGQGGSNPGGTYFDEDTGKRFYIKRPQSDEHARNEVLAAKLYEETGANVPKVSLMRGPDGELRVASEIVEDLTENGDLLAGGQVNGVGDYFAVDAWLANWDVIGLEYDNMLIQGKKAIRLDTGGALLYRAQGSPKGPAFNDQVPELKTLRDASMNPQAARVFGNVTDTEIKYGISQINKIDDKRLESLVNTYGDQASAKALLKTLRARRQYLNDQYGTKHVNPNALKAAESQLKEKVQQAVTTLNDELAATVKGMRYAYNDTGQYRSKDKERYEQARATYRKLINNEALSQKTRRQVQQNAGPWLDEIQENIANNSTPSDRWFEPIRPDIVITQEAIEDLAEILGEPPRFTETEVYTAIKAYTGENKPKPQRNGDPSYQEAYRRITEAHKAAISTYTGSHYAQINRALYTQNIPEQHRPYIDALNEALERSDKFEGKSTRAVDLSASEADDWIKRHKEALLTGQPVRYHSFLSSTKGSKPAFSGPVWFSFKSKKGVWVNPLSRVPGREDEVLFSSGSAFYVADVTKQGNKWIIELTDAPDDSDISKELTFNE